MADTGPESKTFTGRRGRHQTRWTVRLADRVSSVVITVGGIATIVAVCLVFFLLLAVVLPMFRSAAVQPVTNAGLPIHQEKPLRVGVDEYRVMAWALYPQGELWAFRVDSGEVVLRERLLEDEGVTVRAISFMQGEGHFAIARSDGKLQMGKIGFAPGFADPDTLSAEVRALAPGQIATLDQRVVQVTPQHQFRTQQLVIERGTPLTFADTPLRRVHHTVTTTGVAVAGIADSGQLVFGKLRELKNVLTGERTWKAKVQPLPSSGPQDAPPDSILVPGRGDNVYAIWSSGKLVRYDVRDSAVPVVAETIDLFPPQVDAHVTATDLVIGGETLLVGDDTGGLRAWFLVRHSDAQTPDGSWLLPIHELPSGTSPVRKLGISQRSRMIAVGYQDGTARVVHVTTESEVVNTHVAQDVSVDQILFAPKDDGLYALADGKLWGADFDPAYPETTFRSLFLPVWYEGYERPESVWQSSFAGVQSEMKLGLGPLIFGTLKATLYSMMIGVPLAMLAAIYTSEFLKPSYRNRVKSLIEMMASLPSVVLGFLGGLVIAPVIERFVPATICGFVTIPVFGLLGAFLWQQVPRARGP